MVMVVFTLGTTVCPAQAETVKIQFMNFALHYGSYEGDQDFYSAPAGGGTGSPSQAEPLGTVSVAKAEQLFELRLLRIVWMRMQKI
jgi:hypothetical protein